MFTTNIKAIEQARFLLHDPQETEVDPQDPQQTEVDSQDPQEKEADPQDPQQR